MRLPACVGMGSGGAWRLSCAGLQSKAIIKCSCSYNLTKPGRQISQVRWPVCLGACVAGHPIPQPLSDSFKLCRLTNVAYSNEPDHHILVRTADRLL